MKEKNILNLSELVKNLNPEERSLFERFYEFYIKEGKFILPEEIKDWAESKFGKCETQKIIRITNKFTYESTLFNELRAKRPIEGISKEDVFKIIKETEGDFFCDPLKKTPSDVFGRIEGKYCITASNIAKYDYLHAVIVFKNHNPFHFEEEYVRDYLEVAWKWFLKAKEWDNQAEYPFFMWNCLWKAGASIVHGHAQALISQKPYGKQLFFLKIRKKYKEKYNAEYFEDLFKVHSFLGLGFNVDGKKLLFYLTPVKEKEILIISQNFFEIPNILSKVLKFYYEIGVRSFNVGIFLPKLGEKDYILARVVDRGDPMARTSDIGGMEIYSGTSVVASDPFKLAEIFKKYFQKILKT